MLRLFRLLCLSAMIIVPVFAIQAADITFADGQVRVPMPGRTVTSGFISITNNAASPVSLVSVTSDAFANIELHTHKHVDGMMRMEKIEHIAIAAGKTAQLKPHGLHLMLFEPSSVLETGKTVELHFTFSDGQTLPYSLELVAIPKR